MVCMSCLELVPLRSGFRVGRDRFSGESGRSMPFVPLLRPPSTVPSRRSPPNPLLGGGATDSSALVCKTRLRTYLYWLWKMWLRMDLAHRLRCFREHEMVCS